MSKKASIQAQIMFNQAKKNFPNLTDKELKINCYKYLQKEKDHLDDVELELRKIT